MILDKNFTKKSVDLVVDAYRGVSTNKNFTASERVEGSRELLQYLAKDYRRNKITIFEIVESAVAEILPQRVNETIGRFADVANFPHGTAPRFTVENGSVKAYIVADGSRVQRHRLYKQSVQVYTDVIQAKVYEELARVQTGHVDFNDLINKSLEAIEDKMYDMIYTALVETYSSLPAANKVTAANIDSRELNKLIQRIGSYGNPIILGTRLGLSELEFDSESAREDVYNQGFVGKYKGVPCVLIENTVLDETNEEFKFEDRYLYVIPEGKDKIVKVAIEGEPLVDDEKHTADWTMNFETNIRAGVAVLQNHHVGIYDNTSLASE